jgi:hypothetical protein
MLIVWQISHNMANVEGCYSRRKIMAGVGNDTCQVTTMFPKDKTPKRHANEKRNTNPQNSRFRIERKDNRKSMQKRRKGRKKNSQARLFESDYTVLALLFGKSVFHIFSFGLLRMPRNSCFWELLMIILILSMVRTQCKDSSTIRSADVALQVIDPFPLYTI